MAEFEIVHTLASLLFLGEFFFFVVAKGNIEVVCKAARITAHVYSMGHLIHSPAAFHTVSITYAYIDMTNLC